MSRKMIGWITPGRTPVFLDERGVVHRDRRQPGRPPADSNLARVHEVHRALKDLTEIDLPPAMENQIIRILAKRLVGAA